MYFCHYMAFFTLLVVCCNGLSTAGLRSSRSTAPPSTRLVFVTITERLSDVKKEVMTTDRFDFDLTTRRSQRTSTEAKAEEEEKEVEAATRKDEREYKPKSFKTVKMIFVVIFIFVALILVVILVASLISSKMRPQSKQALAVSAVRMPAADTQSNGL